ncbi:MAG: DUF2975 domain-containing protein [Dethiobacteria bacterium]|jgi:hypothetical protein
MVQYLGKKSVSSILKTVLDLVWYLGLAGTVVAALFLGHTLVSSQPLSTGSLQIEMPGLIFRFTDGIPQVLPTNLSVQFMLVLLLMFIGVLVLYQLRKIFATLTAGTPFTDENVGRIRIIGIALIAGALFESVIHILNGVYLSNILRMPGVETGVNMKIDLTGVFMGVVVIILAEVFRYGAYLQEEQDLTV